VIYIFCRPLEKLLVAHLLRPDATAAGARRLVDAELGAKEKGKRFMAAPTALNAAFADSHRFSPVVLVLSPGADALRAVRELKATLSSDDQHKPAALSAVSLGQGQDLAAEEALKRAAEDGEWLVLQNCHLAERWMTR